MSGAFDPETLAKAMQLAGASIGIGGTVLSSEKNQAKLQLYVVAFDPVVILLSTTVGIGNSQKEAVLVANLESSVGKLEQTEDDLNNLITFAESLYSAEMIKQALEEMPTVVKSTLKLLEEDGEYRKTLISLIDLYDERHKLLLEWSKSNPYFKYLANKMEKRVIMFTELRDMLISLRASYVSLLETIKKKIEDNEILGVTIVLKDGQVVEIVRVINDQLVAINQEIQSTINRTKQITRPAAVK